MEGKLLVSVAEAAYMLSLCQKTVSRMVLRGEIASLKCGSRRLVPVAALKEWIDRRLLEGKEDNGVCESLIVRSVSQA